MVRSLASAATSRVTKANGPSSTVALPSTLSCCTARTATCASRSRAFVGRGDHAGERDNKPLITQILALRAERATLLGYETHAHWQLETAMAGEPATAMRLMEEVWSAAVARAKEEVAAQQSIVNENGDDFKIAPWDYRFYMEQVRQAKYDLDDNAIKPYLQLDKLRDGMFWMASRLYNLTFTEVDGLPVVHPDVRVWEVTRADDHVGLFYFDPYARPGKRSGAWMNAYRSQERFRGEVTPIVSNNCNFVKSTDGTPSLLSWDDAETLFHEFGHALHGLLSDVTTRCCRYQRHARLCGVPPTARALARHRRGSRAFRAPCGHRRADSRGVGGEDSTRLHLQQRPALWNTWVAHSST